MFRRYASIAAGVIAGNVLAAVLLWLGPVGSAFGAPGPAAASTPVASGERAAAQSFQSTSDELAPPSTGFAGAALALSAPTPGETQVYFVPTDNDATATVLSLYNTDTVAHVVPIRGYSYNGILVYSLNVNIGATSLLRLSSDAIAAAPPPSWVTPAPVIVNFTDFTYFASLSLPTGVRVEGYTLFNPGTGLVDPRADQGAVPLVFSVTPPVDVAPAVPGTPQNVLASSSGGVVAITWSAANTGGAATGYVLEAGSGPGLANLASVPVTGTSFTTAGVPAGTYYIRVRGVNSIGTGPASADVQLVVR